MSNRDFFEAYAAPAAVGLVGGSYLIDKTIKKAQKKITSNKKTALFSHAFIISEKRIDEKWWVIESDLEFHRKQMKLGVQENRLDKYFDETAFPNVAVLNFNLSTEQTQLILKEALDVMANRATYSLREIFGVLFSFTNEERRKNENRFVQDNSFICSTLVQHCYGKAGLRFNSAVSLKNTTPEDIYATALPHTLQKIIREQ